MSEQITHTAVTDDCARLALHAHETCAAFRAALADHMDVVRLGGITRGGDHFTVDLLGRLREARPQQGGERRPQQKLAFVLGWLCHRAADRQMKPVFRSTDPDCPRRPTDCSVYHDVFLYREVYACGEREPYAPDFLDVQPAGLERLFRLLLQRSLLAMHTFIPGGEDIDAWLDAVIDRRQQFTVDIARYAEAFARPDPDRVKRFITDVDFYDPEDALIRLARALQRGEATDVDLEEAVSAAAEGSQYARALRRAFLYLRSAGEFFEGRLPESEVRERLDIGKPGG